MLHTRIGRMQISASMHAGRVCASVYVAVVGVRTVGTSEVRKAQMELDFHIKYTPNLCELYRLLAMPKPVEFHSLSEFIHDISIALIPM